jgi:hypothetical protein
VYLNGSGKVNMSLANTVSTVERMIMQPPSELEGLGMEFRIVYRGSLPAQGKTNRRKDKQAIRKALHPQLKELWNQHQWMGDANIMASNFARCGFRFMPIIRESVGLYCKIHILFLRRDHPGNLVISGGDIDNRIKVLFDGLRMPQVCSELDGAIPEPDEDPFFCLLQDDSLITEVQVTTDRLLSPAHGVDKLHDVDLTIHVMCNLDIASIKHLTFVERNALEARMWQLEQFKP